jgi:mannose-6-phosphate isomerase-like protein (cupin superfamily)
MEPLLDQLRNGKKIRKITPTKVPKGWGHELHIANFIGEVDPAIKEKGYCLKFLVFNKPSEGSMHFHSLKHEVFYVLSGIFNLKYISPENAAMNIMVLEAGDVVVIPQNNPHRIVCVQSGTIIEASSPDRPDDSYRVEAGDSQR